MISLNSIKNKILIFAILATLIPSIGLGLLSFWQNEAVINSNVSHQLRTLSDDVARELEYWLSERVEVMRTLSSSDAVINGLAHTAKALPTNASSNPRVLSHYLRLVQEKLEPLLELSVVTPAGEMTASSSETPTAVIWPDSWSQASVTESIIIAPPSWNNTHSTPTLTLAVPILSLENKTLGALVAVVDLHTVSSHLEYAADAFPGDVLLLDLAGKPLLSSRNVITSSSSIDKQVLQHLRDNKGQPKTFRGYFHPSVLGLVKLPSTLPVIVMIERDLTEIYQAWTAFRNLFLSLVVGLTLSVGLLAWRMGRSIVTPLEHLTAAAERIAAGDLTIKLPAIPRDEIGHLTQVFNQMADNLRLSHDKFEAASLTLQKQNRLLETLSTTDSLTGLYNRKRLDDILVKQLARLKRNQHPFALLLIDIDHFKKFNDNHGHLTGDKVLMSVAKTLSQSIRSVDYATRYGGEEFVSCYPKPRHRSPWKWQSAFASKYKMHPIYSTINR